MNTCQTCGDYQCDMHGREDMGCDGWTSEVIKDEPKDVPHDRLTDVEERLCWLEDEVYKMQEHYNAILAAVVRANTGY